MRCTCRAAAMGSSLTDSSNRITCQPCSPQARSRAWSRRCSSAPPCHRRGTRLDSEESIWPGDVEMDHLAGTHDERVLPPGFGKSDPDQTLDQQLFETTLSRSFLTRDTFEPLLHRTNPVLAATTMAFEVVGSRFRSDQTQVPRILGCAGEAEGMEGGREAEERPQRCRHDQAVVAPHAVVLVEPGRTIEAGPRGTVASGRLRNGRSDRRHRHRAQSVEPTCGGRAEEASFVEVELERHTTHRECLG